jgi:hypothetical protein
MSERIPQQPTEDDIETYVQENRDQIVRILHHSSDHFSRACAWTLLDRGLPDPELAELQRELEHLLEQDR